MFNRDKQVRETLCYLEDHQHQLLMDGDLCKLGDFSLYSVWNFRLNLRLIIITFHTNIYLCVWEMRIWLDVEYTYKVKLTHINMLSKGPSLAAQSLKRFNVLHKHWWSIKNNVSWYSWELPLYHFPVLLNKHGTDAQYF